MSKKFNLNNSTLVYIFLSLIFVLTIQIFDPFRGNAAHLIHSIKHFDTNKLEYDLMQNYLRLNIESIKFDNKKFSKNNFKAYKSLNIKLNSIDFDLF